MNREQLCIFLFLLLLVSKVSAQNVSFADDERERGYFDRPYLRYEAESGKCETTGILLPPTFDQRELQSEASNQSAVQLLAKDSWIQWTSEKAADGLNIRFSLPDSEDGKGLKGTLSLFVDGNFVETITLDSYWAWQYILKSGSKYPDNLPDLSDKFPRMRFDETHLKLGVKIPAKGVFRLVKQEDNDIPYTIDFVELEEVPQAVTFESIPGENKIAYTPDQGKLQYFITQNRGKTIYLPPGRYDVDGRMIISGDGTQLIGAGMWHTEIYFSASSDDRSTYNQRGIEATFNHVVVEGLYLNTVNNKRYYNNDSRYQVGKGFMGSFGSQSVIRHVWVEHFECGAWIEGADNLQIRHCRFRNNYADGINLAYGSTHCITEHCSFRNNGDDDIATWSRGDRMCTNLVFRWCTSENNWRASGLGFFGGKQNKAYNIVIADPMEAGFRVTSDFPGMPFSNEGFSDLYNISVYKGGVATGIPGIGGDLWGNRQGAVHVNSSSQYDLQNIRIYNIDLYKSKDDGIFIGSGTKHINNLQLKNINIEGTGRYGIFFSNAKGDGTYCNIVYADIGASTPSNDIPGLFTFTEDCSTISACIQKVPDRKVISRNGALHISGKTSSYVSVYDLFGREKSLTSLGSGQAVVTGLITGIYIVRWDDAKSLKVFVQ